MNMKLFMDVYDSIEKNGGSLTMEDLGNRAAERLEESIATNPEFYYGPYTGFVVRNAGYAFAGRLLSNHSRESPFGGNLGSCFTPMSDMTHPLTSIRQNLLYELLGRLRDRGRHP